MRTVRGKGSTVGDVRETRRAAGTFELRAGATTDEIILEGYASTFEPYEMHGGPAKGGWIEQIDRAAFDKTLRASPDLHLLINHEGMPLARTKSQTLELSVDCGGLQVRARLDRSDPDVQALEPKMRRRDMDEMSFAFRVIKQRWDYAPGFDDDPYGLRVIQELSLHKGDVSIVNFGANPTTSAELHARQIGEGGVRRTIALSGASAAGPGPTALALAERAISADRAAQDRGNAAVVRAERSLARERNTAMTMLEGISEPQTYVRGNGQSYFADLIRDARGLGDADAARDRLRRHGVDVRSNPEYRDLDRTPGNGGYFAPPAYLVDKHVALARAGRAYANLTQTQVLGPGISSIEIPKVTGGATTAMQTADNAPVAEQDLRDDSIDAKVRTVAGQQDVAIQLLDQSPVNFDEVIFQDLYADYATKIDRQVLAGSHANGQVKGVRNTPGIGTIALTGAPTVAKFYAAVADGIQRIHTARYLPPSHIVMHPRRWAWLTAAFDTTGRPLSVPGAQVPTNAVAALAEPTSEGVVGSMQGLPVVVDPNIGVEYGDESNEDLVYVQRSVDLLLWENSIRSRVMPEVGAKNLTVLLQVYGYIAFTAERYPQSVVEISGLTEPLFG